MISIESLVFQRNNEIDLNQFNIFVCRDVVQAINENIYIADIVKIVYFFKSLSLVFVNLLNNLLKLN